MKAITTMEQLASLDEAVMVRGYMAGFKSQPDYSERDQAYWHGYLNGQVDCGAMLPSPEQQKLAAAYLEHQRAQRMTA